MYVVNAVSLSVDGLRPIRPLSPFRWYLEPDPLFHGLGLANVLVLAGIAVVAFGVATITFERRDLAT